jgi:hypothetical protein
MNKGVRVVLESLDIKRVSIDSFVFGKQDGTNLD